MLELSVARARLPQGGAQLVVAGPVRIGRPPLHGETATAHDRPATATRRAGRRLEELLLERRPVLSRPTAATPGTLADALVEAAGQAAVGGAVAEELDAGLAWVSVLRSFEREALVELLDGEPDLLTAAERTVAEPLARAVIDRARAQR